jgi:hypothetical protein
MIDVYPSISIVNHMKMRRNKNSKKFQKKGEDNDIISVQSDIGLENGKPGDTR